MKLPIDVQAVIEEAMSLDEASATELLVAVYLDETAPGDVQAQVRQAFASARPNCRVTMVYFPSFPVIAVPGTDMAVIVAGLDANVGRYTEELRGAGVPVMVVTTLPELVAGIAYAEGHPILEGDLVAPEAPDDGAEEPFVLSEPLAEALKRRMGEWVIEACRPRRLAFALAFHFVRRPLALESVRATAAQNAGVGFVTLIPGADLPIMTLNQAKILLQIAAAYGQPLTLARAKELVGIVGGAFACRAFARQLLAVVPALGWLVKGAIGYSGTLAMGYAAVEYFEGGGRVDRFLGSALRSAGSAVQTAYRFVQDVQEAADQQSIAGSVEGGSAKGGSGFAEGSSAKGASAEGASAKGEMSSKGAQSR